MFEWRILFSHKNGGGYYKTVRAWTKWGASRKAEIYHHSGWWMSVVSNQKGRS